MPFDPRPFSAPLMRQAVADYEVALHLQTTPVETLDDGERLAIDAALAKYQQALEKMLKAIIAEYMDEQPSWLTEGHVFLADADRRKYRALRTWLEKHFSLLNEWSRIKDGLGRLEALAPSGDTAAENTEYPFVRTRGPVAPFEHFTDKEPRLLQAAKDLMTLFRILSERQEFKDVFPPLP